MKILNFFEIFEILNFFEIFWKFWTYVFLLLILEFYNFMKVLKFYEIFERVVSLLRHSMGCLPGNNRVVTRSG